MPTADQPTSEDVSRQEQLYDAVFLFAYLANVCMLSSVSLLFRYSDFIRLAGGDEWHLGWIVGFGTTGAILFRLIQGAAIDRLGAMWIWALSLVGLGLSLMWHVTIDDVNSWQVYAARLLMNTCIAGVFGSWLSFVSLRVSQRKVAEVIGVLGTSGFVGMAMGPVIGDWIFSSDATLKQHVAWMFIVSAILIGGSLLCALSAGALNKKRFLRAADGDRTTIFQLLRRHHPGFLLVVGAIMGLGISLPGNFLRPFAESQRIDQIQLFFLTYNMVAFVSRLAFRKAPEILGLRNTILIGLLLMAVSMLLYLSVETEIGLIFPAVAAGLAHSFLFPSVVAGCTAVFPRENRGMATSLILAMYDFGVLIGSPLAGVSISVARSMQLADYPIMFCSVGTIIAIAGVSFIAIYGKGDGTRLVRRDAVV